MSPLDLSPLLLVAMALNLLFCMLKLNGCVDYNEE